MANTYELIVKTVDQSSKTLGNIQKSLDRTEKKMISMRKAVLGIGTAFAAIKTAQFIGNVIEVGSRFDKLTRTISVFTGSMSAAESEIARVSKISKALGLDVEQTLAAFIKLNQFGIDTSSESLTAFANIAAATGKDLEQFGEAVADALTGEFERLKEFGIKVSSDNGKFTAKIGEDQIAIANSTTDLIDQIQKLGEQGGRYFGVAAKQAEGFAGTMNRLRSTVNEAKVEIFKGFGPELQGILDKFNTYLEGNREVFRALGEAGGEVIVLLAEGLSKLADSLGLLDPGGLKNAFASLLDGLASFISGFNTGIQGILVGFAQVNNAIIQAQAAVGNGILIPEGMTEQQYLDDLKRQLDEISAFDTGGMLFGLGGLAGGFVKPTVEAELLKRQIAALEDESTPRLQLMSTEFNNTGSAASQAAENIRSFADQLRDSAQQDINGALGGRGEMYERLGERAAYLAEQERLAADAALQHANANEQLLMSMQVIPTTLTETNAAFSELIQNTNETIAQQELNDELVRRVTQSYQDGYISLEQYKIAMQQLGITIDDVTNNLSGFEQFMKTTIDTAQSSVNQTSYATQAQAALKQQLADGTITLDVYSAAMERVNGILGISTQRTSTLKDEVETIASTYKNATDAIDDYNLKQTNAAGAISKLQQDFNSGKYSLEEFRVGMENLGLTTDDLSDRSIAMGINITDAFTSAGDSLAQGLARGIARGESIMSSFKNFMQNILETILTQIIQQAFINPMISSMTAGFSQAFSAFGAGGVGAFGTGAGILGSLFGGGPLGLLGGFLGFANGGVVPGMPTRGDSVPILATPGEVILNKRQQADVLQGGGEEPVTVNFNISAIDTQTGTEFILKNKKQITGVIQQAYNTRGQSGPLG